MDLGEYFKRMKGGPRTLAKAPISELFFAWIGGFCGIFGIWWLNHFMGIQSNENLYLIGSFGASAVLAYGLPGGPLSQPRNIMGGHFVSGLVGVTAYKLLSFNIPFAGAVAVATAIVAMMATNTTHPPGGATALIAVISGDSVHNLGYWYAFSPALVGATIMVMVAVLVNNLSSNPNRHYPKFWI